MGDAEDLVKNTTSATESPVNHDTSAIENPDAQNPASDQSPSLENLANNVLDGDVNPLNGQEGGAENPPKDQVDGAENPVSDQTLSFENPANNIIDGAVNPVNDQEGGGENPPNDQVAGEINPMKEQEGGVINPANDQVAGDAETSIKEDEGSVEHPLNHDAGGAENLLNMIAGGSENPVIDTICDIENSVNEKAGPAENAVDGKACDIENPVNDEENDVDNSVKQDAAKNLVEDKAEAIETPLNSEEDRLPAEAREILKSLASKWEDVLDSNALQVIPLKGAMTNMVFQTKWRTVAGESSRKVLVRIYGEGVDVFFDRADEIRTFEFMSKHGQGPRLLGRFGNGRVEEFIHARTLSASDLRDPSTSALIAAKMKEFHNLYMPGEKKVHLWDRLRNWLAKAKRVSSPKEVEAFYLDTIDKEISFLEKELSGGHTRIGFCHNDLQYGNIMLDEETNSVTIIDYEYASYNPVAYDIANQFCEMGANYHTETPHILDYKKYPDVEERRRFVKAYLSSSGEQPTDSEVEELLQDIEKYTLANHLFWGIWGIISAQVNKIEFDYKEYAKQRFQEYWARKPYLLSYDSPSPYNAPEATGELASVSTTKTSSKNPGIFRKMKRVLGLGIFRSKS